MTVKQTSPDGQTEGQKVGQIENKTTQSAKARQTDKREPVIHEVRFIEE